MAAVATEPKERASIEELLGTDGERYDQWVETQPSFLDALETWPSVQLSLARLMEIVPKMSPRLYSIASSPLVSGETVKLLCGVVQYETDDGVIHNGLVSSVLAQSSSVLCKVRAAPHMRLPDDHTTPIICVCGGTGLAPF